jgi:hemerythrin-like domain-containing protein
MEKEDKQLFPLVEKIIPVERQNLIIDAFDRFEREENGTELHEKYYGMAERLLQECIR